jgi:hypothetical protein
MTEPLLGLTGLPAHWRTVVAARRQLAALAQQKYSTDLRRHPPNAERMFRRAFTAESFEARSTAQTSQHELEPREFYQSTAGLPELHGLIEQIRPWYPEETIAGLVVIVTAAEKRLIERTAA